MVLKSELLYIVWRSLPAFLKKNLIILEKIMNFSYTYVLSTKLTVFLPNSKSSPVIGWTEIPVVVHCSFGGGLDGELRSAVAGRSA